VDIPSNKLIVNVCSKFRDGPFVQTTCYELPLCWFYSLSASNA